MKIDGVNHQQVMMEGLYSKKTDATSSKQTAFDQLLETQKAEDTTQNDKVVEMIDNIEDVKRDLEQDLTIENLEKYKEAIRSFLEYYTKNELKMDYYSVYDRRTFTDKKVGVIQTINEKVNGLTENMLETNKGHLETLSKIGEIQGLIVNLFV